MPSFNHKSWDCTWWSLGGLLYTGEKADNVRKASIISMFDKITNGIDKLKSNDNTSNVQRKLKEWKGYLALIDASEITYGHALEVETKLKGILEHLEQMLVSARVIAKNKKHEATKAVSPSSSSSSFTEDDEKGDDWAKVLGKHHAVTSKPRAMVQPPPLTLNEVNVRAWEDKQRTMANECDEAVPELNPNSAVSAGWGQHLADRAAILRYLPSVPQGVTWSQAQVLRHQNTHVRVYAAFQGGSIHATVWTEGLSHAVTRNANQMYIYVRTGNTRYFTQYGGVKHPDDYP